jgi:hypothetical protein
MEESQSYTLNPWNKEEERGKSCLLCQGDLVKKDKNFLIEKMVCLSCGVNNSWWNFASRTSTERSVYIEIAKDINAEIWWDSGYPPEFFLFKLEREIYNEHLVCLPTKNEMVKRGIKILKMLNFS